MKCEIYSKSHSSLNLALLKKSSIYTNHVSKSTSHELSWSDAHLLYIPCSQAVQAQISHVTTTKAACFSNLVFTGL